MQYKIDNVTNLVQLLGAREVSSVITLSKKQSALEKKWVGKLKKRFDEINKQVFSQLIENGEFDIDQVDVTDLIMESSLEAMALGVKSAQIKTPISKLAAPPKAAIPTSLKEIRKLWDLWRKGKLPERQKKNAEAIKKAYLKKVQSVWKKYSSEFRAGNTADKAEAIRGMMDEANIGFTRGKMIVQTETTFFYNSVRKNIYDQAESVTHYLFVALRDHATTAWCSTRQHLVYEKDDPLTDYEFPPCHWNCRSEMLPLTPSNPNHAKLIKDSSKQRRNRNPEPLPPEWSGLDRKREKRKR